MIPHDHILTLDKYCKGIGLNYFITGTTALSILGVPSDYEPQDIDIKVFNATKEQIKELEKQQEQQELCGFDKNEKYESACFTMYVKSTKVNIIVVNNTNEEYDTCIRVNFGGNMICIQQMYGAIHDKMKLSRSKDSDYMLNLINKLSKTVIL